MSAVTDRVLWPEARAPEALAALVRQLGLSASLASPAAAAPGVDPAEPAAAEALLEDMASEAGLELQPVTSRYRDLERMLSGLGTALLRVPGRVSPGWVAVLRGGPRRLRVLAPDGRVESVGTAELCARLRASLESRFAPQIEDALGRAGITGRRQALARAALLRERLGTMTIAGCWVLGSPPGAPFGRRLRELGFGQALVASVSAYAVHYVLWLLAWWTLGLGALQGRVERGWLLAWGLLLATSVPLRFLAQWAQALTTTRLATALKQRLLWGSLHFEPEEIRREGSGQLLGRVIECEAVESLGLRGSLLGMVSIVEVIAAAVVLSAAPGGAGLLALLGAWLVASGTLAVRYLRERRAWTSGRLELTHDLVEKMVGQRTRVAQQPHDRWHHGEDAALAGYLARSAGSDGWLSRLLVLVPRGWMVVALLAVGAQLVAGEASTEGFALALAGVLLGERAFRSMSVSLSQLGDALISWEKVRPLYQAAARRPVPGALASALRAPPPAPGAPVIEAKDLVFRHSARAAATLQGCSLSICAGDRVLLEGRSGGGKSTLGSLLAGLRSPQAGALLLRGLDLHAWGSDAWRRQVAGAPQFHENHVLSAPFSFNLLMGRAWPPAGPDVVEAGEICRELGLGPLLSRMPGGIHQMVGETGWQLSHGERSRLFIARALLQGAELLIFDESFAALDPENLRLALECVRKRARTLLVVAHP